MTIIVFISGSGTNLQTCIDMKLDIKCVISNRKKAYGLVRAKKNNIHTIYQPWFKKKQTREEYDNTLVNIVKSFNPTYIFLLGWMHIFSSVFIKKFGNKIINMHPALPGEFPGAHSIKDAFESNYNRSGIMMHNIIEEIDAGKCLSKIYVPKYKTDTFELFKKRMKNSEKIVLQNVLSKKLYINYMAVTFVKHGKVRDIYRIGYNLMAFAHSDRQSAFDRQICNIPGKGQLLNKINCWWMNQTSHIIPNHYVWSSNNVLVAKECTVIPIEVVVRGYITGSTKTSLWTHYNRGIREYCGVSFPDGLVKDQKLEAPVLTPTTKGDVDEPISADEIVRRCIVTQKEWDYISSKALELFEYGTMVAKQHNLILVDTKYEFGRDVDGNIILIDEIHTCDSSRYWVLDKYEQGQVRCLDKDAIRNYVRTVCEDPYSMRIPEIPKEHITKVFSTYKNLYETLANSTFDLEDNLELEVVIDNYFNNYHKNTVVIISGSTSDETHVNKIKSQLENRNVYCVDYVASAHRNTKRVLELLEHYEQRDNIVWVTVAGMSNALSGVVAANTKHPVIACPPFKDKDDMMTNINSTLQCPRGVPVMTILHPVNVAESCLRMLR